MINRTYGCIRSVPDERDHIYSVEHLPAPLISCDNSICMPPIWDQKTTSSCVGHGTTRVYDWCINKEKLPYVPFSRLFTYYNARKLEGTTNHDGGAQIRDAIKGLVTYGVCPEQLWPFSPDNVTKTPDDACYKDALQHLVLEYQAVPQDITSLKQALCYEGPVVLGLSLYGSFETEEVEKTGIVPMPTTGEDFVGGHCVALVDYDDKARPGYARLANSWGTDWGDKGYFYLPWAYLTNTWLTSDLWVITKVESYK